MDDSADTIIPIRWSLYNLVIWQISNFSQGNQSNMVASLVAKNLPIKSQIDSNNASRNQHNSNLGYGSAAVMGGLN